MATKLTKIIANFSTQISTNVSVGGTTLTLASNLDKENNALPSGKYCFTLNQGKSNEQHFLADVSGTAITNVQGVDHSGDISTGFLKDARINDDIKLTDYVNIKTIVDILNGDDTLDGGKPVKYDTAPALTDARQIPDKGYIDTVLGALDALVVKLAGSQIITGIKTFLSTAIPTYDTHPTFTSNTQLIDKKYADDLAIAGAPNASETTKGIVEEATQDQTDAGTAVGETGARLFVNPSKMAYLNKVLVAGENITAYDSVFVAKGDETRLLNAYSYTETTSEAMTTTQWLYQSFTTSANTTKIGKIRIKTSMSGSGGFQDTINYKLRATPNGANLATATGGSAANGDLIVEADFGGVTVTPNTTYYLIISRQGSVGGTLVWKGGTTSSYSGGASGISTNSGSTWTTPSTTVTGDFYFQIFEGNYTSGKVYKTVAATDNYSGNALTENFIGFALSTVSASANETVRISNIISGLSGLTPGATYYLSNTPGAISTSPGTVSKKIGIALSATDLLIKHDN